MHCDSLAMDLQTRTAEYDPGWYNPQTEVGRGGLTSTFAASQKAGITTSLDSRGTPHFTERDSYTTGVLLIWTNV